MDTRRARNLPASYIDRVREKDTAGRRFELVTDEIGKAIHRASQIAVEKEVQNAALHYVTCYVAATANILLNRYISSFFFMICFNIESAVLRDYSLALACWTTGMTAWPKLHLQMEETEKGADDGILERSSTYFVI